MIDKLLEEVRVETFLLRVRCPNRECEGVLEHDGKTRTENGVHGGKLEYRHRCSACSAGYWLAKSYPQLTHKAVAAEVPVKKERKQRVEAANGVVEPGETGAEQS